MGDRRGATEAMNTSPKLQGCVLKSVGMLLLGALCALIGYAYGQFKTYKEAERDYAEVLVAAFYDPDARRVFFEEGSATYVREELDKVLNEHGEAESYKITRVDPGPAKTFIDVRVVRNGKQFDEDILFIARKLRDFTSEPVGTTDSSQNPPEPAGPSPSPD